MATVFVDTHFWVAVTNPRDQWHEPALAAGTLLDGAKLVTTDTVLTEVLNYFSGAGPRLRRTAAASIRAILEIEVVYVDRVNYLAGLGLYESRPDKGYSLTDCISMNVMRAQGISAVLTNDAHFTQEGFEILL